MPDYSEHMTHDEYVTLIQQRLLELAHDVLGGTLTALEGCTLMTPILYDLELHSEDGFSVIVGTDSAECDRFLFFDGKKHSWSTELLSQQDVCEAEFFCRPTIERVCTEIINRYERTWAILMSHQNTLRISKMQHLIDIIGPNARNEGSRCCDEEASGQLA